MTILHKILSNNESRIHATDAGTKMHALLQRVVIDKDIEQGDQQLIQKIKQHPELLRFFVKTAKTEVPIAGNVQNKFVSRRIDRLLISDELKTIDILDYKTDLCHDTYYGTYVAQLREYARLLQQIYPDCVIKTYILWTHDFSLENII